MCRRRGRSATTTQSQRISSSISVYSGSPIWSVNPSEAALERDAARCVCRWRGRSATTTQWQRSASPRLSWPSARLLFSSLPSGCAPTVLDVPYSLDSGCAHCGRLLLSSLPSGCAPALFSLPTNSVLSPDPLTPLSSPLSRVPLSPPSPLMRAASDRRGNT